MTLASRRPEPSASLQILQYRLERICSNCSVSSDSEPRIDRVSEQCLFSEEKSMFSAASTRFSASPGQASAADAISFACASESLPDRKASDIGGWASMDLAASSIEAADPTDSPVSPASHDPAFL